jgi:hypothetical protein
MRGRFSMLGCCLTAFAAVAPTSASGQSSGATGSTVEIPAQISQPDSSASGSSGQSQAGVPHYEEIDKYTAATNRNSSQVHLSADGRSLEGYTAGTPFPMAGSNRPRSWNQEKVQQPNELDAESEAVGIDPDGSKTREVPGPSPDPGKSPE